MHATPICERAACLLCFLARRTSVQCPRSLPHLRLRRRRTFFLSVFLYLSPPLPSFLPSISTVSYCLQCLCSPRGRKDQGRSGIGPCNELTGEQAGKGYYQGYKINILFSCSISNKVGTVFVGWHDHAVLLTEWSTVNLGLQFCTSIIEGLSYIKSDLSY